MLINEIWRPVPGEDHYEVSNLGRVKSLSRLIPHGGRQTALPGMERQRRIPERILDGYMTSRGRVVAVGARRVLVARLVLLGFLGAPDGPRAIVRRANGEIGDDRLVSLSWGSMSEVERERTRTGSGRLLTYEKADEIREMFSEGFPRSVLSKQYGVSMSTITAVTKNKIYVPV